MSSQSFADLGISPAVCASLARQGIEAPFPIQKLVVPDALEGHDILVKSPTGSGKTLAFTAPIVDRIEADGSRPAALVVAPTRELALQILEDMRPLAQARALSATAVYGGAGLAKQAKLARRSHIIVATPERLLDMGFRPDVDRIVARIPRRRQTLLFSATLEGEVLRIADAYTRSPRTHSYEPRGRATRVEHRFVGVSHESRLD